MDPVIDGNGNDTVIRGSNYVLKNAADLCKTLPTCSHLASGRRLATER
jgi:hypothetical protein